MSKASVLVAETTVVVRARGELRPKALLFGRIHYSKVLVCQAQIVGRILVHNDKLLVFQAQIVGRILVRNDSLFVLQTQFVVHLTGVMWYCVGMILKLGLAHTLEI